MKELDKKDFLLLDMLNEGSRKGLGKISKELKMHKNSISYRINRLKKLGIIKKFSLVSGIAAMGKDTFYVFFRLRVNPEEKKEVFDYLVNHPLSLWVVRLSGTWNVLIELICDDIHHFNDELVKITDYLGDKVLDYTTTLMYLPYKIGGMRFVKDSFSQEFKPPKNIISLDSVDKKIMGILSDDSSVSYLSIGQKVGVSPDSVFYRVKKLSKDGIIRNFCPIIDFKKIGFQNYIVKLKLSDVKKQKFNSLREYLINNRHIQYAFRTGGELGVFFFCAYKSNADFDNFLTNLTNNFGDIIKEQDVIIANEVMKLDYFPKGLRK